MIPIRAGPGLHHYVPHIELAFRHSLNRGFRIDLSILAVWCAAHTRSALCRLTPVMRSDGPSATMVNQDRISLPPRSCSLDGDFRYWPLILVLAYRLVLGNPGQIMRNILNRTLDSFQIPQDPSTCFRVFEMPP